MSVTAARGELKIGDEILVLSPLTDRDIEELDRWLQSRMIRIARESLTDDMSEADRKLIMSAALSEASRLTWMSGAGAEHMQSLDGLSRMVWQGLRKEQPHLSEEVFREKCRQGDNLGAALDVFNMTNEDQGAKPAKKKKRAKAKTKNRRSRS